MSENDIKSDASVQNQSVNESPFKRISTNRKRCPRPSRQISRKASITSIRQRGGWSNRWEFFLSCVGLSVGIGNVWRFPYLAYQNGGGAFLIPYLIMLILAGKPMYFMELAFGQFGGVGPLTIWNCAPIAKGVGVAMVSVSFVVCVYYNVVMAYTLYFIYHSFASVLPWERCDTDWAHNTNCTVRSRYSNITGAPSSQVFWENKVLDISDGIEHLNGIKWDLALCLLITWIIVILCLLKGIKESGKIAYFTATFPYLILISLLIAGVSQEGSWDGIKYFIIPEWKKLLEVKVWKAAAGQMFFSLGVSMGGLIMFSSYNDFRHNIFQDAMIVSILDTITSIIVSHFYRNKELKRDIQSGIVIFSVLGAMAKDLGPNVHISEVAKGGPGLAFATYPEALTRLPFPQLWSVLFFFMLFMLGIDTVFATMETVLTSLSDEVSFLRRHRLSFCIFTGILSFILGLPCVTRGGQYIIEIIDNYGGSFPLIFIAMTECVALIWIYGFDRFSFDINYMLGVQMGTYLKLTWKYTSPIILTFIFVYSLINYQPLKYGDYHYPDWANLLGICLTLIIVLQVPVWAIYAIYKEKNGKTLIDKIKLSSVDEYKWGPRDDMLCNEWRDEYEKYKSIERGLSTIRKGPVVLRKVTKIDSKLSADNPSFVSDIL